ncbi:DUF1129 family protein [uncultured Ruthenibacterium sp.]|uniref:DUF1129 family protein n=1 Tax=uncultured Ruthenibacterium sp. TaxID=1905347 RepID=UPI00349EF73E
MNHLLRTIRDENNQLSTQLSPENQALETNLVVYLRASAANEYQQEKARRDILQMMLEGQARGDTMENVLGDGKEFCDALIAELPPRTLHEKIVTFLGNGGLYLGILFVIWAISALIQSLVQGSWPHLPVSAGSLLNCIFIPGAAGALVLYICRTSFAPEHPKKGLSSEKKSFLFFLTALLVCMLCSVLLRGIILFSIPAVWAPVLILICFAIHKVCDVWLDRFYAKSFK